MHASVRPALSVNIPQTGTNTAARESAAALSMRMAISKVNFFYGNKQTLFDISMGIATNKVTALIGPSGCGKSTLDRKSTRLNSSHLVISYAVFRLKKIKPRESDKREDEARDRTVPINAAVHVSYENPVE